MNHERDRRDDDEHHHRDGVKQDAEVKVQVAERQPCGVVGHQRRECAVGQTRRTEEILVSRHVAENGNDSQRGSANQSSHFMAPDLTRLGYVEIDYANQQEADEGKEKDK